LNTRRERRNQRRERAFATVRDAAAALLRIDEPRADPGAAATRNPESLGALYPEAVPFATRTTEALVVLSIDFGCAHWLLEEYEKVAADGLGRVIDFHEHVRTPEESRGDQIREFARKAFREGS